MSSLNTNERTQFAALQDDYRRAWHAFTIEVESLRITLNTTPVDEDLVQQARQNVEISAGAYREARNALAVRLLHNDAHTREIDHDIAVVLNLQSDSGENSEELWPSLQTA